MAIVVRFAPVGLTAETYDRVSDRVRSELDWPPDGLDYHVCFGTDGDLRVSEIWDSQEQFEAFGAQIMPLLSGEGIDFSGEPEVYPVHHIERA